MVVHIDQMSQGFPTVSPETTATKEPTESFDSVLANAGKVKLESEKALEEKGNCAEDVNPEEVKAPDPPVEQTADATLVAASLQVPQMVLQTSAEVVNPQTNGVSEVASMEQIENLDVNTQTQAVTPVQFSDVETIVSENAEQSVELMSVVDETQVTTASLEQVALTETDAPEVLESLNTAENQISENMVANDKSLLTNADNAETVNLQHTQVVPTEETVRVETGEVFENLVSEQNGGQAEMTEDVSRSDDASVDFVLDSSNVQYEVQGLDSIGTVSAEQIQARETVNSVSQQVVAEITRNLEDVSLFKNELSFTLNPENLGQVSVKMVVENGVLTVEFSASSKETQTILAANLESIRDALKNLSTDNQVNQIMQETHPDYLQQHNEQSGGNNRHAQEETSGEQNVEDVQLTENFLSMLNMFGSEDI